jgi:hypothetical protein
MAESTALTKQGRPFRQLGARRRYLAAQRQKLLHAFVEIRALHERSEPLTPVAPAI